MNSVRYIVTLLILATSISSCQKPVEQASNASSRFLYVTAGLCYSGNGITTFSATTSSNIIFKVNTDSGSRDGIIADYNATPASAGDTPLSMIDWTEDSFLVLVRNGTTGRLETLPKKGGTRNNFGTTPAIGTIISTAPKAMAKTTDGGVLLIRTGFMEKINSSGIRFNTPYVSNNLGATCGTANTLYTDIAVTSTGRIVTANAAATPNNRVVSVPAAGASASCAAGLAAPATTTFATAMVYDSTNKKLLVAYAGPTTAAQINSIHAYDFDESTGAISNDQVIYDANLYPATYNYLLFGISAMAFDPDSSTLYVATAISNATTVVNYAIEKLNYNAAQIGVTNSAVLTKTSSVPFYNYGVDTKCISSMVISNEPKSK